MPKMLIADDNRQITSALSEFAKKENYAVSIAYDGEEALKKFGEGGFDIILLDVMMPKIDGFEVCKTIRKISTVPIIMITARGDDFERIMGLDIGADDYIVKPFSTGEVMARARAVLRRFAPSEPTDQNLETATIDNLTINMDDYTVSIGGNPVPLTKKEIELLWTFARHPGRVYTRDNLLDLIWGYDYFGDNRTVVSHIKRLRAKLDVHEHPNWEISTVWGVGYKFEARHEK